MKTFRLGHVLLRDRSVVDHEPHKLGVAGSIPAPATTLRRPIADNAPASPRFNQSVRSDKSRPTHCCIERGDRAGWFYSFVPMTTLGAERSSAKGGRWFLAGSIVRLVRRLFSGVNPHGEVGRQGSLITFPTAFTSAGSFSDHRLPFYLGCQAAAGHVMWRMA